MAVSRRPKRVTDPLDNKVKAQLQGRVDQLYATTSGSEHEKAEADADAFFCGLVHAFLESESDSPTSTLTVAAPTDDSSDQDDEDGRGAGFIAPSENILRRSFLHTLGKQDQPFRLKLLSDVSDAVAETKGHRRAVVRKLRESGYNAGLCKAKWEGSRNLTAGSYEYIDVIAEPERRYVVDVDFSLQFEIARATQEYKRVVEALPRTMVGTEEEVGEVVRLVGEAARRSLKSKDMHVPPWRKTRYMLAKWRGPYHRTTTDPLPGGGARGSEVKSRVVGFHAVKDLLIDPVRRPEGPELAW